MANVNIVILIGRLSRDVEYKTFANGGAVSEFGFCVNKRVKNTHSGQWEDKAIFIECKVFNRGESKMADNFAEWFKKGDQVSLEASLDMDQWQDKQTGANRSKHYLIVDRFQSLKPVPEGGYQNNNNQPQQPHGNQSPRQQRRQNSQATQNDYQQQNDNGGEDDPIPF